MSQIFFQYFFLNKKLFKSPFVPTLFYVKTLIKDLQSGAEVISSSYGSTKNIFQILNETSKTKKYKNEKSLKYFFIKKNIF